MALDGWLAAAPDAAHGPDAGPAPAAIGCGALAPPAPAAAVFPGVGLDELSLPHAASAAHSVSATAAAASFGNPLREIGCMAAPSVNERGQRFAGAEDRLQFRFGQDAGPHREV